MFSEVLLGIKSVIQTHLLDVQCKFEGQFQSLGFEIRRRDVLIDQLQHRIYELENGHSSPIDAIAATSGTGNGSTGSSGDIAFVVRSIQALITSVLMKNLSISAWRFVGYNIRIIAATNRQ